MIILIEITIVNHIKKKLEEDKIFKELNSSNEEKLNLDYSLQK